MSNVVDFTSRLKQRQVAALLSDDFHQFNEHYFALVESLSLEQEVHFSAVVLYYLDQIDTLQADLASAFEMLGESTDALDEMADILAGANRDPGSA